MVTITVVIFRRRIMRGVVATERNSLRMFLIRIRPLQGANVKIHDLFFCLLTELLLISFL